MKLAIIGGSLCGDISGLGDISEQKVNTPYGEPSDACMTVKTAAGELVYLNRHGRSHHIAPHMINYRANLSMLKELGITHVVSVTAVGGITGKMSPMQWVVPDQLIDYTWGRSQTFYDGRDGMVRHIDFTFPFDKALRKKLHEAVEMEKIYCLTRGTYGVTQGPRLETLAEIERMEKDGCDLVGMTAMPEAGLARELDMKYATLSLVVNWAAGKGEDGSEAAGCVSLEEITQLIAQGNSKIQGIIKNLLSLLYV